MKFIFFIPALFFLCTSALGKSLCSADERIVFSCEIESKNVSACLAPDNKVRYAYGTEAALELELDDPIFSSTGCVGGGISRLRFRNGDYSYIVYDVMCNSEQIDEDQWSKTDFVGVIVMNKDKVIASKGCTDFIDEVLGVNTGILPKDIAREDFDHDSR